MPCFLQLDRSEEHTSELQSLAYLVCRLLLEKKKHDARLHVGHITDQVAPFTRAGNHGVQPLAREYPRGEHRHDHGRRLTALCFFFNDTATTEIYTLSLHDALPIFRLVRRGRDATGHQRLGHRVKVVRSEEHTSELQSLAYLVCRLLLEKKKK